MTINPEILGQYAENEPVTVGMLWELSKWPYVPETAPVPTPFLGLPDPQPGSMLKREYVSQAYNTLDTALSQMENVSSDLAERLTAKEESGWECIGEASASSAKSCTLTLTQSASKYRAIRIFFSSFGAAMYPFYMQINHSNSSTSYFYLTDEQNYTTTADSDTASESAVCFADTSPTKQCGIIELFRYPLYNNTGVPFTVQMIGFGSLFVPRSGQGVANDVSFDDLSTFVFWNNGDESGEYYVAAYGLKL